MSPLIDTNAFIGPWPFTVQPELTSRQLADRLRQSDVECALVSHLGAVFQPEPMPANRALFAALRGVRSFVPVPVLNPALATWREHFDACRAAVPSLRAVRLFPNYHGYHLRSRHLERFMSTLAEASVRLVLSVRIEDERQKYFALRIAGVPTAALSAFLQRFREHEVLCTGLYRSELVALAAKHANFCADVSFLESITTVESLRGTIAYDRLMFGSCAPLLSVAAQAAKIQTAEISVRERDMVGAKAARRFFKLPRR